MKGDRNPAPPQSFHSKRLEIETRIAEANFLLHFFREEYVREIGEKYGEQGYGGEVAVGLTTQCMRVQRRLSECNELLSSQ